MCMLLVILSWLSAASLSRAKVDMTRYRHSLGRAWTAAQRLCTQLDLWNAARVCKQYAALSGVIVLLQQEMDPGWG